MEMRRFYHRDYLQRGEAYHLVRSALPHRSPTILHDHDYPEIFWIARGRARHFVNGAVQSLAEGDLVFVRPQDRHGFQGLGKESHLVNIVLAPDSVSHLPERYPELTGRFFWDTADAPRPMTQTVEQLFDLSDSASRLETGLRSRLRIESFVLSLMSRLADQSHALPEAGPGWLMAACRAAEDPEVFRAGAAGFVQVTGRAHAHVSRTARRYLGQTPSDYVNVIRMDYAARQLISTSASLTDIARDCGIENMSHFHRLFKARHGITPKAFRARYRREAVQPA